MASLSSSGTLSIYHINHLSFGSSHLTLVVRAFPSSGDSVGLSAAESKKKYDEIARRHPSTVLALNHEVYGMTVITV